MEPDAPVSPKLHDLKDLQVARTGLVTERTRLRNRSKTQINRVLKRQTKTRLALVERQITELDTEIAKCIAEDAPMARKREILRSIPGVGHVAAAAILTSALRVRSGRSPDGVPPAPRPGGPHPSSARWGENRSAASPVWHRMRANPGNGKASRSSAAGENPCAMRSTCPLSWPCGSTRTSRPSTLRFAMPESPQRPSRIGKTAPHAVALMRKLLETANALVKADRLWVEKAP